MPRIQPVRVVYAGLLALFLVLVAAGCGETPLPTPVPSATAAPVPVSTPFRWPSEQRTIVPVVLPTRTPVGGPAVSALPGAPGFRRSGTPGVTVEPTARPPVVYAPEHTPGPTKYAPSERDIEEALAITAMPCMDDFLQTVLNYDGAEEFGAEVAERLSDEFKARRVDCAEQGWNPGFPRVPAGQLRGVRACFQQLEFRMSPDVPVGRGVRVPSRFEHRVTSRLVLKPSMLIQGYRGASGNVVRPQALIHFHPLPFMPEASGCWLNMDGYGWWWVEFIPGSYYDTGYSPLRYPECEALLRTVLADLHASGETLDVEGILAARGLVSVALPDFCTHSERRGAWALFPSAEAQPGCPVDAPTGALEDGGLVVHWDGKFPDAQGGSACWALSADGEWSFHASIE